MPGTPVPGSAGTPSVPAAGLLYPDTLPIIKRLHITGVQPADPACGQIIAMKVCTDPTHPTRVVKHSCGRSGCVTCWTTWATRAAHRAADRLRGFSEASNNQYVPWHITLSPPATDNLPESEQSIELLYQLARKHVDLLGVTSSEVIIHGYRINPDKKREVNDGASVQGVNRYRWALDQDNPRDYLIWSPHFHLIGWGYLMDATSFFENTGWVYRKHLSRPVEHQERTLYYLLSHAWHFGPGRNCIRYWGGLAPTKMTVQEDRHYEPDLCKVCGASMRRIPVTADGDFIYQDIASAPCSRILVVTRRYHIKKKGGPPRVTGLFSRAYLDEDNEPQ